MKKLFTLFCFLPFILKAQVGIITTIGGTGSFCHTGTGVPVISECVNTSNIYIDDSDNIYFSDQSYCQIYKINPAGIVNLIAGTGAFGFTGDGGPALSAKLYSPGCMAKDGAGNLYFADFSNARIRKIDISGIITTVAGNGVGGYSGDGGPATSASIAAGYTTGAYGFGIAVDSIGNIYIADGYNNRVRKVSTAGIISTIAGTGTVGFSGDGGPALLATVSNASAIAVDRTGNIIVSDGNRLRMIDASGNINTIAGNGVGSSNTGDGGLATAADMVSPGQAIFDASGNIYFQSVGVIRKILPSGIIKSVAGTGFATAPWVEGTAAPLADISPSAIALDANRNIYLNDNSGENLRKITFSAPTSVADSFSVFIDKLCSGPTIEIMASSYSPAYTIKSWYGDGSYDSIGFTSSGPLGVANFPHVYSASGDYSVKHVLYNSGVAVDSIAYTYNFLLCKNTFFNVYYDANADCIYDDTDLPCSLPLLAEVDSNYIPIDTISLTSGNYYTEYGNPGDLYSFRIISFPGNFVATCPSTGEIDDTLVSMLDDGLIPKNIGLACSSSPGFDLGVYVASAAGKHEAEYAILADNAYCNPQDATLTMNFSPKYTFGSAWPTPTMVSGNTITWDFSGLSAILPYQPIVHVYLDVPGTWLLPGDTAMSSYTITPVTGDVNIANNAVQITDTVRSSFDPNEMSVAPQGIIASGTTLQYTINFENTGNDTAKNIYVMDTLSDRVNVKSLRVLASSATMDIAVIADPVYHNIVKFAFPHINLQDSSHHNDCDGFVVFTVASKNGLADGTTIPNHAGIFFDDNGVVMTDTVVNVIGQPTVVKNVLDNNNVGLFPVPVKDELTISVASANFHSFTVSNYLGQPVTNGVIAGPTTKVSTTGMPAGVYTITLKGDNGVVVKKFTVL